MNFLTLFAKIVVFRRTSAGLLLARLRGRTAKTVNPGRKEMHPAVMPNSNGVNLTSRQQEIVKLIAKDLSAKEIGGCLGISAKTVEFHRYLIRQRLEVRGTAGIVRYAIQHGIIDE